ncbi:MAG TPA: AraC family transcriptional regulator [Rudaea sp.]|jgi:AraC-like DNA-binding protein|nr:AraC family transcriptional regulator [Rudaea sp.]
MHKLRQVRLSYPDAFAELTAALAIDADKRHVASAFSIPVSTVYRWLVERREQTSVFARGWTAQISDAQRVRIGELIETCERDGFAVQPAMNRLLPGAFTARAVAAPSPLPITSGRIIVGRFDTSRGLRVQRDDNIQELHAGGASMEMVNRIVRVKIEIDRHYYTRLSCEILSAIANMTRFNLIKAFKHAFGVSPYRYLNQVRVDHARHMLALTDQPMHMIAAAVGFGSVSSLTRAFKRFAGASPSHVHRKLAAVPAEVRSVVNF